MSLKILGGLAKGLVLQTAKQKSLRPTSILLKRRFFDYFQDFSGHHFYYLGTNISAYFLLVSSSKESRYASVVCRDL